jgi:hypothetical protein
MKGRARESHVLQFADKFGMGYCIKGFAEVNEDEGKVVFFLLDG